MNKFFTMLAGAVLTVGAASAQGTPADLPFAVTPASGTVTELSTIEFTLPADSQYASIEFGSTQDEYILNEKNKPVAKIKFKGNETRKVTLSFDKITTPGTYTYTIYKDGLTLWPANLNDLDNPYDFAWVNEEENIVLSYTIEGEKVGEIEFTANPASGSKVENLATVTLVPAEGLKNAAIAADAAIEVAKNGEAFSTCSVAGLELKLAKAATEYGTYTITIPAGAFTATTAEGAPVANSEAIVLTYKIADPADAVVYDLKVTNTKPAEGVVDMEKIQFDSFTLNTDCDNVAAKEGATVTLTCEENDYTAIIPLKRNFGKQLIAFLKEEDLRNLKFNGTYVLTVPKGCFGDAKWAADNEEGRSNEEFVFTYTFTGLQSTELEYNIVPDSFLPAGNAVVELSEIVVRFNGNVKMIPGSKGHLTNIELKYFQESEIVEESTNTFKCTFPSPTEIGTYTFVIERGVFGDSEYIADQNKGRTNDTISHQWDLITSGINGVVVVDTTEGVYNMMGVKVADSAEGLAPGMYIAGGKKFVVK